MPGRAFLFLLLIVDYLSLDDIALFFLSLRSLFLLRGPLVHGLGHLVGGCSEFAQRVLQRFVLVCLERLFGLSYRVIHLFGLCFAYLGAVLVHELLSREYKRIELVPCLYDLFSLLVLIGVALGLFYHLLELVLGKPTERAA